MQCVAYPPVTYNTAQEQYNMQYQYEQQLVQEQQYLAALMAAQQAQIQQMATIPVQQKLVIFDWDDTIFPTTALFKTKEPLTANQLEEFGKSAYEMIVTAMELFSAENIYIVTNGKDQWVQKSIDMVIDQMLSQNIQSQYWSEIRELLATSFNGHVISARSLYEESTGAKQTTLWKTLTFKQIAMNHFDAQSECTIISIGDSSDEFNASFETKQFLETQCGVQTVQLNRCKLERRSSSNTMMAQFSALTQLMESVAVQGCSCDVLVADYIQ